MSNKNNTTEQASWSTRIVSTLLSLVLVIAIAPYFLTLLKADRGYALLLKKKPSYDQVVWDVTRMQGGLFSAIAFSAQLRRNYSHIVIGLSRNKGIQLLERID